MGRKFLSRLRSPFVFWPLVAAAVAIVAWLVFGRGAAAVQTAAVARRTLSATVAVTGSVAPLSTADLGFEVGGRLAALPVLEGAHVYQGQLLAALDSATLQAQLADARASLALARAQAGTTATSLDQVQAKQDTLVANAHQALLSGSLAAVPVSSLVTLTPPTISGLYQSAEEGRYKLRVVLSPDGVPSIRYFGLEESAKEVKVEATSRPVPLGTRGLYVTFSTDPSRYVGTDWTVDLPNLKGSSYPANYAAYQSALAERDRAVAEARADLDEAASQTSVAQARIDSAAAQVAQVQAQLAQRAIVSPFAGLVKKVNPTVGEIVAAGAAVVTLITDGAFEIDADLPEVDANRVHAGMPAEVGLEAIAPGAKYAAKVLSVDRAESRDGGVPVYKMKLTLDQAPAELRSGMTADVTVNVASAGDVLAVPVEAVSLGASGDSVTVVREGGSQEKVTVSRGLLGDDGFVEVRGALSAGDRVLLPTRP